MLLAAVDLGSNSFRLEIGKVDGDHIARHGYWKETVRLAGGLDESNKLSKKAIDIAVETLARMNERLRGMKNEHVRAVGTQSLRQARNLDEFLLQAQHALGFPIEVISGREEARLVFEGCMHTLPPSTARRLVVDIGGASTEVIVGKGFEAESAESFKVGCVNTSLRFFKDGRIDRSSLKKAQVAAAAELEEAVVGGAERNRDACGDVRRERVGHDEREASRHRDALGVRAVHHDRDDALADLAIAHAGADREDRPAALVADDVRNLRHLAACAVADVAALDRNRLDPDQHAVRRADRIGDILVLQHGGGTGLVIDGCLHRGIASTARWRSQ